MRFLGVIPARYASTRLPGKPLLEVGGKTLVQWVYQQAERASHLDQVIVAADDQKILDSVRSWNGMTIMTSKAHASGTDRVMEVAQKIKSNVYINLQCDEPLISPKTIDQVCACFKDVPRVQVATACVPIQNPTEVKDPHTVKVVTDFNGWALYFSRAPIPYSRGQKISFSKHLGLYGYRRNFLLELPRLSPSPLEEVEKLEQLRFLENGIPIRVTTVKDDSIGVDTWEDLERVRPLLENVSHIRVRSPQLSE